MPRRVSVKMTAAIVACVTLACAVSSDRLLIDQFFTASRLRDRTALARFSTVIFEPRSDGIVDQFTVTGSSDERILATDDFIADPERRAGERQHVVRLSLGDGSEPVEWARQEPVFSQRQVTLLAKVRALEGAAVERRIVVTLQRAAIEGEASRQGRWIVVGFGY